MLARERCFLYISINLSYATNKLMSDPARVKADIVPYTAEYSRVVRSWVDSEETYLNVSRGTGFPPPDDVVDSWQRDGVSSYLLFTEGKPVAYGELWIRKLERTVEIVHLIVDQYRRSRGYGTKMLELLFNRAASRPDVSTVLVNLSADASDALGCYLKAGFELAGTSAHVEGLRMMRLVQSGR